ncbi:MAG: M20 family metallopeptidase [Kosmotogaceae bacterium]|nr:M20 family metallopeptidase [Kosmotogaceae bacterium]
MKLSDKEVEKLLLDLCSANTTNPPGKEDLAAVILHRMLVDKGVDVEIQRVAENRSNVVARLHRDSVRPYLVLSGHMDVVPAGSNWDSDPFKPELVDGKLIARGSADMKGGLSALIAALIDLSEDSNFSGNVALVATCDEEVGCSGIRYFLEHQTFEVSGVIIGEPTSLRLATGEKGAIWLKLKFRGKSAHGSQPQNGVNAITRLFSAYTELSQVLGKIEGLTESLNIIRGGSKENTVPDEAECVIDIRFAENTDSSEIIALVDSVLSKYNQSEKIILLNRESFSSSGNLTESVKEVLKKMAMNAEDITMTYFTDGAFTASQGIETVILGPGSPSMAHRSNEYVELEEVHMARRLYVEIARNYFERTR